MVSSASLTTLRLYVLSNHFKSVDLASRVEGLNSMPVLPRTWRTGCWAVIPVNLCLSFIGYNQLVDSDCRRLRKDTLEHSSIFGLRETYSWDLVLVPIGHAFLLASRLSCLDQFCSALFFPIFVHFIVIRLPCLVYLLCGIWWWG